MNENLKQVIQSFFVMIIAVTLIVQVKSCENNKRQINLEIKKNR